MKAGASGMKSRWRCFACNRLSVRKLIIPAICLVGLSVLIAALRFHSYSSPVETNVAVHCYLGHELLQGRRIYTDCFDHQPPAVAGTFAAAEVVAGYGPRAIYFAVVAAGIVTLLGVYRAGSADGRVQSGLWAGLFWAVISCDCRLYMFLGETEVFINATLTTAFALLVRAQKRLEMTRCVLIGLLFTLGTFYKHTFVIPVATLSVFHVLVPPEEGGRTRAIRDGFVWLAIGVFVWCASIGYFWLNGRFTDYWDAVFRFNWSYAQDRWNGTPFDLLTAKLSSLAHPPAALGFTWPLLILTLSGFCFRARTGARRWLLLMGLCLGLTGVLSCSEFLVYHYAVCLPLLAIGAAWGIATVCQRVGRRWALSAPLLGLGTAALLFSHEIDYLRIPGKSWTQTCLLMSHFNEARDLAKQIDDLLAPNESFFVWGDEPSLYIYTRRDAPTPYFWLQGYFRGPLTNKVTRRVLDDLETKKPPLVVYCKWRSQSENAHPVYQYVSAHYTDLPALDPASEFQLAARTDSPGYARMLKVSVQSRSAVLLAKSRRVTEATRQYREILRIEPSNPRAHFDLGAALVQEGKLQEAIPHFEQAARLKADYVDAHVNLGSALVTAGRFQEAIGHYEQALRLKPDSAEAHNSMGYALSRLGKLPEAIHHWEQALKLKPDYADVHYNWGVALARLGRMPEAISHWRQALQIQPDSADTHNNLGAALEKVGRVREAIDHYTEAVRINPDSIEARQNLARAQTLQNEPVAP